MQENTVELVTKNRRDMAHQKHNRAHYLDNLRGILMVLGIVLHSAAGFSSDSAWLINYTPTLVNEPYQALNSTILNSVNALIHSFRMPLFFMVSGYFSILVLTKVGPGVFIKQRLLRVAVPLLVCILTFNAIQSWILSVYRHESFITIFKQQAVSHLWFLINLLIYSGLLLLIKGVFNKSTFHIKHKLAPNAFFLLVVFFPFFVLPILAIGQAGIPIYQHIPILGMPYYLFYYFGFFVFGVLLQQQSTWTKLLKQYVPLWIVLFSLSFLSKYLVNVESQGLSAKLYANYIDVFIVTSLCLCLWGVGMYVLAKQNTFLSKLAESSYSIYLVHHCLVVGFVIFANVYLVDIVSFSMQQTLLSICCMFFVFFVSYYFHRFMIRKSVLMRKFFNGK